MTTAQVVIDRVREVLNDDAQISVPTIDPEYRYSDAKLLAYLTLAQREILKYKPEAGSRPGTFIFASTDARQRLDPAAYYRISRVDANLDTTVPETPVIGASIRTVERDLLDTFYAMWPEAAPTAANGSRYKVACVDSADPLAFWVFPQPVVDEGVAISCVPIPPAIDAVLDPLWLSDMYIPPLVDFMCHVALRSEDRAESDMNASTYHDSFLAYLGHARKTVREVSNDRPSAPEANE